MGGNWRMPTIDEIKELLANTTNKWISNYNGSGRSGKEFTSKTNGNSIFIPTSGVRSGTSFSQQFGSVEVWSSSLYTAKSYDAWELYYNPDSFSGNTNTRRYYGVPVRGVFK